MKPYIVIDAETEPIRARPDYPPKPVGWAVQFPGERKGSYDCWGHPTKNTPGGKHRAEERLRQAWASGLPILCQHGKFDLDVAEVHHGLPLLPWERTLDTEYLLFLHDPHARSLSLKPSAERILGIAPEERDELREWLIANVPEARKKPSEAMAWICKAPGDLVGRYALGDLLRTKKLNEFLAPSIDDRGMRAAYERERKLMPIFLETERTGIRTDYDSMEEDVVVFQRARERVGDWLRKKLKRPELNLDSDKEVGDVLCETGIVTDWTWTKGGKNKAPQRSVSKKNMTLDTFNDRKVAMAYGYYTRCGTLLSFFLEKWLALAGANGGWLKPNWNQVRQSHGANDSVGTRTGRPSCDNPNFLAIVKIWENNKGDGYTHPAFIVGLPPLALARSYLLPDTGGVILHRDFNQQELRMLAHYEDGELAAKYSERPYRNPDGSMRFDIHTTMQAGLGEIVGIEFNRDLTKIIDFSGVYGKGKTGLAADLGVDYATAARVLDAKAQLMPGVDHPVTGLAARVKQRGVQGLPIRTWGGREYYVEPPKYVEKFNRVMDFNYKLLNVLVQGGSADVTKEVLVRYHEHPKRESRFLVTVYDEINVSTPSLKGLSAKAKADCIAREMAVLRECMETIETDVPMLSDGKVGENWGALKRYWTPEEAREII